MQRWHMPNEDENSLLLAFNSCLPANKPREIRTPSHSTTTQLHHTHSICKPNNKHVCISYISSFAFRIRSCVGLFRCNTSIDTKTATMFCAIYDSHLLTTAMVFVFLCHFPFLIQTYFICTNDMIECELAKRHPHWANNASIVWSLPWILRHIACLYVPRNLHHIHICV